MPWWLIVLGLVGVIALIRWGLHLVGGLLGVGVLIAIVLTLKGVM